MEHVIGEYKHTRVGVERVKLDNNVANLRLPSGRKRLQIAIDD
jgi:hypothetical protein